MKMEILTAGGPKVDLYGSTAMPLTYKQLAEVLPLPHRGSKVAPDAPGALVTAAMYCRFSTPEQDYSSIDRQSDNIGSKVAQSGSRIAYQFLDPEASGRNMERKGLKELLACAEKKMFQRVFVEDVDRLSRRLHELMYIYDRLAHFGIELWDYKNGRLDLVHVVMLGVMAQQGRDRMLDNMRGGRLQKIKAGKIQNPLILGYMYHPHQPEIRMIDPDWKPVVEEIFSLVANGVTSNAIAKEFNVKYPGARPNARTFKNADPNRTPWYPALISSIVRNPLYMGVYIYGKISQVRDHLTGKVIGKIQNGDDEITVARIPDLAFIPLDLWSRANEALNERQIGKRKRGPGTKTLFKGIIKCACGSSLTESTIADGPRVYQCMSHREHHRTGCGNDAQLVVRDVQFEVLHTIYQHIFSKKGAEERFAEHVAAAKTKADQSFAAARQLIEERLQKIRAEEDETWDKRFAQLQTATRMAERRQALTAEIETLETHLRELNSQAVRHAATLDQILALGPSIADYIGELPFVVDSTAKATFQQSLQALVRRIEIHATAGINAEGVITLATSNWTPPAFVEEGQLALGFDEQTSEVKLEFVVDIGLNRAEVMANRVQKRAAQREQDAVSVDYKLPAAAQRAIADALKDSDLTAKEIACLMNGIMFALKTKCDLRKLPSPFGDPRQFFNAVCRFGRHGWLDRALMALRLHDATLLEGLDMKTLEQSSLRRHHAQRAAMAQHDPSYFTETAGHRLLKEAKTEKDPEVARRKRGVGWSLCGGLTHIEIAKRLGCCTQSIVIWRAKYKADPIHGLDKGPDQRFGARQMTPELMQRFHALYAAGHDPVDPKKPLTLGAVLAFARSHGLTHTRFYIIALLSKEGLSIRRANAARIARESNTPDSG